MLNSEFKRIFSLSMYKNLKIMLGEMSFFKDFINDDRGDLYPVTAKSENCKEYVQNNRYILTNGTCSRMFCRFFPFASYELTSAVYNGEAGFIFQLADVKAEVKRNEKEIIFSCGEKVEKIIIPECVTIDSQMTVSCRPSYFDVYLNVNGKPEHIYSFNEEKFSSSNDHSVFSNSYVSVYASGSVEIKKAVSYIDNGVSLADIRPIKYENGEIMTDRGNVYLTASVRMQAETFQAVFSWTPSTSEFEMTGAVFYDSGDGKWRNYVAPTFVYDRKKSLWYVWVSAFAHERILGHACFDGDPRFGVNVIDVKLMQKADEDTDITSFRGFPGDEDPDLIFDHKRNKWLMAVCRIDPRNGQYCYYFFESDSPCDGFEFIGRGNEGSETGGSFVKLNGGLYFVCGNGFEKHSNYRIYSKNGMTEAKFNYPDGGFRGWGSVMPVKMCGRTRIFFMTFDRHRGSDYNWSYGNIYCFELD